MKLATLYPFQVFRHRVYLPVLSFIGILGDLKRGIKTQEIIELSELGIDSSVGARFETISYSALKNLLTFGKNKGFDNFLDIFRGRFGVDSVFG